MSSFEQSDPMVRVLATAQDFFDTLEYYFGIADKLWELLRQQGGQQLVVNQDCVLNDRPLYDANHIIVVPAYSYVEVIGEQTNGWLNVRYIDASGTYEGWMNLGCLVGSIDQLGQMVIVEATKIYSSDDFNSEILTEIPAGTSVGFIRSNGVWIQVAFVDNGAMRLGWVFSDRLSGYQCVLTSQAAEIWFTPATDQNEQTRGGRGFKMADIPAGTPIFLLDEEISGWRHIQLRTDTQSVSGWILASKIDYNSTGTSAGCVASGISVRQPDPVETLSSSDTSQANIIRSYLNCEGDGDVAHIIRP